MKNSVYMVVTRDEYELPILIADNAKEMAELTSHSINSIYHAVSRPNHGFSLYGEKVKIIKVEVDEDA